MKKLLLTTTPAILVGAGGAVLAETKSWPEPFSAQSFFEAATQAASQPAPPLQLREVPRAIAGERL